MKTYNVYAKDSNLLLREVKCPEEFVEFQYDKTTEYIVEVA